MSVAVHTVGDDRAQQVILKALGQSKGLVTVGDVVARTGLSRDEAENNLRLLLSTHEGHLEVTDEGELLYKFDPKLVRRDHRSSFEKFKESAAKFGRAAFKVWIVVMLVGYFVLYLALAIAAIAAQSRESSGRSRGIPIGWIFYIFWTPDWHYGSRYYGDSRNLPYWEARRKRREGPKVPFYKKVFAFVFGPDEPERDPLDRDRELAAFIRSRRGALTTAELVEYTGQELAVAESEMARLMLAFNGDVEITDEGELVYTFAELMRSAESAEHAELARGAAWNHLAQPKKLTGNKTRDNTIIGFFNGFNLMFAIISPSTIFPALGFHSGLAWFGLVWLPLTFSVLFFAIPLYRMMKLKKANREAHLFNVRAGALRSVFGRARKGTPTLTSAQLKAEVGRFAKEAPTEGDVEDVDAAIEQLALEFNAEPEIDEANRETWTFHEVSRGLSEGERLRAKLRLDRQDLGEVVFASDESLEQDQARLEAEFDKELELAARQAGVGHELPDKLTH